MARDIESANCTAEIMTGDANGGAILSRNGSAEGQCLKDRRREAGRRSAGVLVDACLADEQAGIIDPQTAAPIVEAIRNNPDAVGINMFLDMKLGPSSEQG